jgi:hypothetical protein
MQMPAKPRRLGGDDSRSPQTPSSLGVVESASAEPGLQSSRTDAVAYIGELSSILAQLSRQHRLATLNYLLELARMEADASAAGAPPSNAPAPKRRRDLARG